MDAKRRYFHILLFALCIALAPVLCQALGKPFYLTQLTMSAYYALVSLGLCLLMGYAGQISMGQAGFFAIGAYTSALISLIDVQSYADTPFARAASGIGLLIPGADAAGQAVLNPTPWLGCVAALVLAAIVAALIGIPVLKLKGHYLAMATLGFGVIIEKIVRGTQALGGADGLNSLPAFPILPGLSIEGGRSLRTMNFYIAWSFVLLGLLLLTNLIHSRAGRALRALHDGEEAAEAMGVDTASYKLKVFILGAVFAAASGVFLSHYNGSIGPSEASVMKSVRYVSIVAVGGMANLWGTLIVGTLLNFLSLRGVFGSYDDAVFGFILIVVMLFAPDGFLRLPRFSPLSRLFRLASKNGKGDSHER